MGFLGLPITAPPAIRLSRRSERGTWEQGQRWNFVSCSVANGVSLVEPQENSVWSPYSVGTRPTPPRIRARQQHDLPSLSRKAVWERVSIHPERAPFLRANRSLSISGTEVRRSELQAHLVEHENIQLRLRRHGNRTYGSRLAQKEKQIPQGGPILPTTNTTTTTTTIGTPPAPGVATSDGDDPHGNLANVMRHDASYLIFRRFAAMNIRNILRIQSELAHLEKRLEEEGDVTGRLQDLAETRLLAYSRLANSREKKKRSRLRPPNGH